MSENNKQIVIRRKQTPLRPGSRLSLTLMQQTCTIRMLKGVPMYNLIRLMEEIWIDPTVSKNKKYECKIENKEEEIQLVFNSRMAKKKFIRRLLKISRISANTAYTTQFILREKLIKMDNDCREMSNIQL